MLKTRDFRELAQGEFEGRNLLRIWADGPLDDRLRVRRWDNALAVAGVES